MGVVDTFELYSIELELETRSKANKKGSEPLQFVWLLYYFVCIQIRKKVSIFIDFFIFC